MTFKYLFTLTERMFAIDLRSLACFRIIIGLILIFDLTDRSFYIIEDYSDWGLMPRDALRFNQNFLWAHSLHALSGSPIYTATLFLLQGIFAFCFLIGYRTWLMNILCWLLLCSLFNRNNAVLSGADALLRALLFWSLFLPIGARFSVDGSEKGGGKVFSGGSIAILLQFCFMYWFSVVHKWNPDWLGGKALYYALNIDQFVTDWGKWLRLKPKVMELLTYVVPVLEAFGPVLALFPLKNRWPRAMTVFTMILLHIGFGLMLYLGIFPYVVIAGWVLFIPSEFWDRGVASVSVRFSGHRVENFLAIFMITCIFIWNVYLVRGKFVEEIPFVPRDVIRALNLDQNWNMFSRPLREDGWFIILGKLVSGKVVDLAGTGKPIDWSEPVDVAGTYPNSRRRKYMMNLTLADFSHNLPFYCKWQCRKWNEAHQSESRVEIVQVIYMVQKTEEDGIAPPKKTILYTHYCN